MYPPAQMPAHASTPTSMADSMGTTGVLYVAPCQPAKGCQDGSHDTTQKGPYCPAQRSRRRLALGSKCRIDDLEGIFVAALGQHLLLYFILHERIDRLTDTNSICPGDLLVEILDIALCLRYGLVANVIVGNLDHAVSPLRRHSGIRPVHLQRDQTSFGIGSDLHDLPA